MSGGLGSGFNRGRHAGRPRVAPGHDRGRSCPRGGVRSAARFTATVLAAAAALVAALAPAALRYPASILQNTVAYPLGLTSAKSPAQSPLPGHLLATLGSGGHLAALVLLAAAGLAIAASLVK